MDVPSGFTLDHVELYRIDGQIAVVPRNLLYYDSSNNSYRVSIGEIVKYHPRKVVWKLTAPVQAGNYTFTSYYGAQNHPQQSASVNVDVYSLENIPPVAVAKSMHKHNNVGSPTFLNGSASYDPDGSITLYEWNFGDGNYDTGETTNYSYASYNWNGTAYTPFDVILTVTDDGSPPLDDYDLTTVNVYIAGDANGDGVVNIMDASTIGLNWGATGTCEEYCWMGQDSADQADLNNDLVVNIIDTAIVGLNWGNTA
jgi:hypothetical protein